MISNRSSFSRNLQADIIGKVKTNYNLFARAMNFYWDKRVARICYVYGYVSFGLEKRKFQDLYKSNDVGGRLFSKLSNRITKILAVDLTHKQRKIFEILYLPWILLQLPLEVKANQFLGLGRLGKLPFHAQVNNHLK